MAKNFEMLIFGGLHEKHAVQRGIWVPTQHSLWDQGKPRKSVRTIRNTQIQSVPHRKHIVSATEPNRLMLSGETVAV
jgi:hypothetical protein